MICAGLSLKTSIVNCTTGFVGPKPKTASSVGGNVQQPQQLNKEFLSPEQRVVYESWCEAITAPPQTLDEDFFEAGGDSVKAIKFIACANERGWKVTIQDLFKWRTIRTMTEHISLRTAVAIQAPHAMQRPPKVPLSYSQLRLFFIDQLEPNSVQYSTWGALELQGSAPLAPLLQQATLAIVQRHESLRTRFVVSGDDDPHQLILPPKEAQQGFEISEFAYPGLQDDEQQKKEEWIMEGCKKEVLRPFNLQTGPLLRLALFRVSKEVTILFVNAHHIIVDGWSYVAFLKEISYNYNRELALSTGDKSMAPSPLPALPFQYADFSLWQRALLESPELKDVQLSYWKKELEGAPEVCDLPLDRPRAQHRTYAAGTHTHVISSASFGELCSLGRSCSDATPFMTVLSVFLLLLHLHSQRFQSPPSEEDAECDVVAGIPTANRHYPGVDSLIGFFVNTLAIRLRIPEYKDFGSVLTQVKEKVLAAQGAQDIPFDWVVEAIGVVRKLNIQPLVQVMFVMDDWDFDNPNNFSLEGIQSAHQLSGVQAPVTKFDLTLHCYVVNKELHMEFEFARDVFDQSTIQRMALNIEALMKAVTKVPSQSISNMFPISVLERHQLEKWNCTEKDHSGSGVAVHHLFEANAAERPSAPALKFLETTVTYEQLNSRANKLAHHLIATGKVGPGVFVPIIAERSIEMYVAIYAVLKAGSAYIPLDPMSPSDRLSSVFADSQPPFVLLSKGSLSKCLPSGSPRAISVLEDSNLWENMPTSNPPHVIKTGQEPIYAILTSGSTGKPKLAVNHHIGAVNHGLWLTSKFGLTSESRFLVKSPFYFDASVADIFFTLIVGSCGILCPLGADMDPEALLQLVFSERITWIFFVPAVLKEFISVARTHPDVKQMTSSLKLVYSGGDALLWEDVARFTDTFGDKVQLINVYGPSEASCGTTSFDCLSALAQRNTLYSSSHVVPLGRPIDNVKVFVLDRNQQPVPVGVVGEMFIGGTSVGMGYMNREELNSKHFVSVPALPCQGKLYRTGDIGRFLPNGELAFVGRADFQVKLRGLRIELGEIEECLHSNPFVKDAVVTLREDTPGDKFLAAYLTLTMAGTATNAPCLPNIPVTLSGFLKSKLPSYMVPSTFTVLSQFPLTSAGKTNRKALPKPAASDATGYRSCESNASADAAEDSNMSALEKLIQECLKESAPSSNFASRLRKHTDFFDAGGNSIQSMRALAVARRRGVPGIVLRDFFEGRTIAGIAALVQERAHIADSDKKFLITAAVAPRPPEVPLSFAQSRLFFLDKLKPGLTQYNMGLGMKLQGTVDEKLVRHALLCLVRRHESLRTRFIDGPSSAYQSILPEEEAATAFEMTTVELPGDREEEDGLLSKMVVQELGKAFDLQRGPLVRLVLCHLGTNTHGLLISMHHIVSDGWSLSVFIKELAHLYNDSVPPHTSTSTALLPPLPLQYADFTLWQQKFMQDPEAEKQITYWKKELKDVKQVCDLPLDRPRTQARTYALGAHFSRLPSSLFAALVDLGRRHNATPFVTLLAVFQVLLHRYSPNWQQCAAQQADDGSASSPVHGDIVVGTPTANRHYGGVEGIIGFFVNTLAIRLRVDESQAFTTTLEQVKRKMLAAQVAQDVPFEWVVEHVHVERSLEVQPLVQAMFVMDEWQMFDSGFKMNGVQRVEEIQLLEREHGTAKLDLTLFARALPNGGDVEMYWEFAKDIFDASTIARMAKSMEVLCQCIVTSPDLKLSELTVVPQAEATMQLEEWNCTEKDHSGSGVAVHHLFEANAAERPSAPALKFLETTVTYEQLNSRANKLAHHLIATGKVGPGVFVPIIAERSIEMYVAIYAVLKAGSAYIPLDPMSPSDRLSSVFADSQPPFVLLSKGSLSKCLPSGSPRAISVLEDSNLWENMPTSNPPHVIKTGQEPIYAILTSGSTGKPKLAVNHHIGAVNHGLWLTSKFGLTSESRFLVKSPFYFDASVADIFFTLIVGSCGILCPLGADMDPEALLQLVFSERITWIFFVPAVLKEFISVARTHPDVKQMTSSLKLVYSGGDALLWEDVARFTDTFGDKVQLINVYGPSEASCGTTSFDCLSALAQRNTLYSSSHVVPLGRPIDNVKVFVLDRNQQPVPVGVVGEMFIGGTSVGMGYMNREELNSKHFVSVPALPCQGKLYRTGDIGRFLPNGELAFVGRADFQVKLRGLRIELGEIEECLHSNPFVKDAVVTLREDTPGDKFLAAYVVPTEEILDEGFEKVGTGAVIRIQGMADDLVAFLSDRLPRYMVPTSIVLMQNLPLSASGKVQRNALSKPAAVHSSGAEDHTPPSTEKEKVVFALWKKVFGFNGGVKTNFFEAGGNSMHMTRITSEMLLAGLNVTLEQFFKTPTVAGVAANASSSKL
ncbi:non-ribosomal peptide synthetase [Pelomyxa schiedti]|nr:non-ribosomal peptide synthetase [Pelomyxa schiedti]